MGQIMDEQGETVLKWHEKDSVFLFLLSLWYLLPTIMRSLNVPDEGRYADVARWMQFSGDWLIPRINGMPFFHKPPLLYWIDASFFTLFGAHAWVARLAPALAAISMTVSTFVFVRACHGTDMARRTALILASSLLVFGSSQYVNHDMLVASWIVLAIFCFADALLNDRKSTMIAAYMACGFGFLSKGLIGPVLPGMVIVGWLIAAGESRKLPRLLNPSGILAFLVIALPWPLLVERKYPDFLHYFFIDQQFGRYTTDAFNNQRPWWFYVAIVFVLFLPWSVLVMRRRFFSDSRQVLGEKYGLLYVAWFFLVFVFFSVPKSKMVGYVIPLAPPLAILIASNLPRVDWNRWRRSLMPLLLLATATFILLARSHLHVSTEESFFLALLAVLVMGVAAACLFHAGNRSGDAVSQTLMLCAAWGLCMIATIGLADTKNSSRDSSISHFMAPGVDVVFYKYYWFDLPFLMDMKKPVAVVGDWESVKSDNWSKELSDGRKFFPASADRLWSSKRLGQEIEAGKPMLIIAKPDVALAEAPGMRPVYRGNAFNAYLLPSGIR